MLLNVPLVVACSLEDVFACREVTNPCGCVVPFPVANAAASSRSAASENRVPSWTLMSESIVSSNDASQYASALKTGMLGPENTGSALATSAASPIHSDVIPAEDTPFHADVLIWAIVQI